MIIQGMLLGGGGSIPNPYTLPFVITPSAANVTPLTLDQSLTGSAANAALAINPTWNTTGAPTALLVNVTNTASNSASLLFDFQVGGGSIGRLRRDGVLFTSGGFEAVGGSFTTATFGSVGFNGRSASSFLTLGSTTLVQDAANIFAQRNGTTAQTFRVYGSFTDASNGDWLNVTKVAGGAATISTVANGTGTAHDLVLQGATGTTLAMGRFGDVYLTSGSLYFGSSSANPALVPGANSLTLSCFSAGAFQRLNFAGTTSSFPALKRNGAVLETRLADDSAYAPHAMQYLDVTDGITAPGAGTGRARIYVDTADGDLKVVFADGTVKTIVVDT